jgi:hypothetical protein
MSQMENFASLKVTTLIPTGYPLYAKQMMVEIQTRGLEDHITYASFSLMYHARYPATNRETIARQMLEAAKSKPISNKYSQEEKNAVILELEDKLVAADEKRLDVARKWDVQEQQLKGLFLKTTEERYHHNINQCKSAAEIWKVLKKDSNQEEPGTMMALLSQFFNFKFVPGEKLLDYLARAQSIAQKVVDFGREPTWEEMKCYLVLMRMPKEYYAIQQSLFQYEWGKIDMDLITKKFSAEDSRQIANRQTQIEESKNRRRTSPHKRKPLLPYRRGNSTKVATTPTTSPISLPLN